MIFMVFSFLKNTEFVGEFLSHVLFPFIVLHSLTPYSLTVLARWGWHRHQHVITQSWTLRNVPFSFFLMFSSLSGEGSHLPPKQLLNGISVTRTLKSGFLCPSALA